MKDLENYYSHKKGGLGAKSGKMGRNNHILEVSQLGNQCILAVHGSRKQRIPDVPNSGAETVCFL